MGSVGDWMFFDYALQNIDGREARVQFLFDYSRGWRPLPHTVASDITMRGVSIAAGS